MVRDENDLALVRHVQGGNKQAFNLLVQKYQYRVKQVVSRFVKDSAEQEDIVQNTFIKAYRALPGFRGDSAFYTWLYRIAVNTAKNHLAAAGRRPPVQHLDGDGMDRTRGMENLVDTNSPEAVLQNDQMIEVIRKAIHNLPEELKEALELREFDGLSYAEIATAMDCPIGTVRSRIFRAREVVGRALEDLEEEKIR